MQNDPYAERKRLTFAQAEGAEPLPQPLALKEVSQELRARLWGIVQGSLASHWYNNGTRSGGLQKPWNAILRRKHIERDHKMADEFNDHYKELVYEVKRIFEGNYVHMFDFLQWLLRQHD